MPKTPKRDAAPAGKAAPAVTRKPARATCEHCGDPLPPPPDGRSGRPRRYCKKKECQRAAARNRQRRRRQQEQPAA